VNFRDKILKIVHHNSSHIRIWDGVVCNSYFTCCDPHCNDHSLKFSTVAKHSHCISQQYAQEFLEKAGTGVLSRTTNNKTTWNSHSKASALSTGVNNCTTHPYISDYQIDTNKIIRQNLPLNVSLFLHHQLLRIKRWVNTDIVTCVFTYHSDT